MAGSLNSFQRAMLQWNALHAYNAVHVVQIPNAFDAARLTQAINGTLEAWCLTGLTLNQSNGRYEYHGGPANCEIKLLAGEERPQSLLCTEIERQLNTAFPLSERINPFRFFVVPDKDFFSLGLVYFHAVADAESIVQLFKDMVETYLGRKTAGVPDRLELYPRRYDNLIRHAPQVLARKCLALPALVRNVRKSCRPPCRDPRDLRNGFTCFSLSAEDLHAITESMKAWEVTLNDLFLALLLQACAPLATRRTHAQRRRKISIGSIVNLRRDLRVDSQRTFGLFLGSFLVMHEVPSTIGLRELAQDIHRQTRTIKRCRLYLATPLELAFARCVHALFSVEQQQKFYRRHFPLWGGITNLNLNSLWSQRAGEPSIDYLRAVSTGPVTPLVLSVTTVRDIMNIGLTYRSTIFSADDIARMKSFFLDAVKHLETRA